MSEHQQVVPVEEYDRVLAEYNREVGKSQVLAADLAAALEREQALWEALRRYEKEAPDWLKPIARAALAAAAGGETSKT